MGVSKYAACWKMFEDDDKVDCDRYLPTRLRKEEGMGLRPRPFSAALHRQPSTSHIAALPPSKPASATHGVVAHERAAAHGRGVAHGRVAALHPSSHKRAPAAHGRVAAIHHPKTAHARATSLHLHASPGHKRTSISKAKAPVSKPRKRTKPKAKGH